MSGSSDFPDDEGGELGVVLDDEEVEVEGAIGDFDGDGLVEGGVGSDFGVDVSGVEDLRSFGIDGEEATAVEGEEDFRELEGDGVGAIFDREVVAELSEAFTDVEGVVGGAGDGGEEGVDGEVEAAVEEGVFLIFGAVGCGEGATSSVDGVDDFAVSGGWCRVRRGITLRWNADDDHFSKGEWGG